MSAPKEEPTGHQPPADPLPEIYRSSTFPGVWRCMRCAVFMDESNVEAHRARHQKQDAIAEASAEILRACQDLTNMDQIHIEDEISDAGDDDVPVETRRKFHRLWRAIRARRALD